LSANKEAGSRPVTDPETARKKKPRPKRGTESDDLGRALRTVYDETVREDVPDDFLDLLGKLG
jgi:hypothetical protein